MTARSKTHSRCGICRQLSRPHGGEARRGLCVSGYGSSPRALLGPWSEIWNFPRSSIAVSMRPCRNVAMIASPSQRLCGEVGEALWPGTEQATTMRAKPRQSRGSPSSSPPPSSARERRGGQRAAGDPRAAPREERSPVGWFYCRLRDPGRGARSLGGVVEVVGGVGSGHAAARATRPGATGRAAPPHHRELAFNCGAHVRARVFNCENAAVWTQPGWTCALGLEFHGSTAAAWGALEVRLRPNIDGGCW